MKLTPQESCPFGSVAKIKERWIRETLALTHAPGEVCAGDDVQDQAGDLPCKTCNHDVDAHLCFALVITSGRGGNTAASSLQYQSNEIAEHERDRVGSRLESGFGLAVHDHDACQAKVNCCSQKSGADGEADDVDKEGIEREWVVVRHDTSDIASKLKGETAEHADEDAPCSAPNSKRHIDYQ